MTGTQPRLVVGADGVWSKVRKRIAEGAGKATFSGNVAWRFTLGEAEAPAFFDSTKVTAFLGGGSSGRLSAASAQFQCGGDYKRRQSGQTWDSTLPPKQAGSGCWMPFRDGTRRSGELLRHAVKPAIWPLYEVSAGAWNQGDAVVLIGDAAHAMMPFAAQGAAMAIEDAFELASFVAAGKPLAAFADHRKSRVARVRSAEPSIVLPTTPAALCRLGRDLVAVAAAAGKSGRRYRLALWVRAERLDGQTAFAAANPCLDVLAQVQQHPPARSAAG